MSGADWAKNMEQMTRMMYAVPIAFVETRPKNTMDKELVFRKAWRKYGATYSAHVYVYVSDGFEAIILFVQDDGLWYAPALRGLYELKISH